MRAPPAPPRSYGAPSSSSSTASPAATSVGEPEGEGAGGVPPKEGASGGGGAPSRRRRRSAGTQTSPAVTPRTGLPAAAASDAPPASQTPRPIPAEWRPQHQPVPRRARRGHPLPLIHPLGHGRRHRRRQLGVTPRNIPRRGTPIHTPAITA